MSASPFISIIIPTLNEEAYIDKLLASLANQTTLNFEVIVVDAHSEDTTRQVVAASKVTVPLVILTSPIRNLGFQRNFGARRARGEYLLFMDADTWVKPDFMGKLTEKLLKKHPEIGATAVSYNSQHAFDTCWTSLVNITKPILNTFGQPLLAGCSLFCKKTSFKKLKGFNKKVVYSEDFELSDRAAKAHLKSALFFDPIVYLSNRRFEREGRIKVIRKYWKAFWYMKTIGPITRPIFDYDRGGNL